MVLVVRVVRPGDARPPGQRGACQRASRLPARCRGRGGLVETPYQTNSLLIAPGERYDLLVELGGAPGDELVLRTVHYDRGHDIPDPGPIELLTFELADEVDPPAALPERWGTITSIVVEPTTARRRFILREDDSVPTAPVFSINDEAFPDITPVEVNSGSVEIWEVENATEMDHTFHLHGMSCSLHRSCTPCTMDGCAWCFETGECMATGTLCQGERALLPEQCEQDPHRSADVDAGTTATDDELASWERPSTR